jgi:hypothetical protein
MVPSSRPMPEGNRLALGFALRRVAETLISLQDLDEMTCTHEHVRRIFDVEQCQDCHRVFDADPPEPDCAMLAELASNSEMEGVE